MRFSRRLGSFRLRGYPVLWIFVYGLTLGVFGIFLVGGVVSQPPLAAELPAVLSQVPGAGSRHVLVIAGDGRYFLDHQEVDFPDLGPRIRQFDPDERQLLLVVEPGVLFREVARVWRLCREVGATQIHIASMREAS